MTLHGETLLYTASGTITPIFDLFWSMYKVGRTVIFSMQSALAMLTVYAPILRSLDASFTPTGIGGSALGQAPSDQDPSGPSIDWAPDPAHPVSIDALFRNRNVGATVFELTTTAAFSIDSQGQFALNENVLPNLQFFERVNLFWTTTS